MSSRKVTDEDGRTWECALESAAASVVRVGQDVILLCTTGSVARTVRVAVGWQWQGMSERGLARMVANASDLAHA